MAYDFSKFKNKTNEIEKWLKSEFSSIHTGRAMPALLDGVTVDSYGANTAINHIAAITAEDQKTLRIAPWDKSQIKDIEKAINDANLGVSVSVDDQGLRVFFPELTTERRHAFIKIAKEKLEEARISVRNERDKTWNDIQEKEKNKEISEDDKYRLKDELQKQVDAVNKILEGLENKKEQEILS
jgi:ribosome recycling factor